MAMTLPLSPASDAQPASPTATGSTSAGAASAANTSSNNNSSNNSNSTNTNNNNNEGSSSASSSSSAAAAPSTGAGNGSAAMKRKPSRRANTAERRATHNAVERQRRETLNGRFLDLASLLPNLSQIRRPSKSSIVNSSIAHIHASRRHRILASTSLRALKTEADALRRELNEWRDRAGIPRVEEPVRGEAFGMVLSGELELVSVVGEEEGDEDGMDGEGEFGAQGQGYMEGVEDDVMPLSAGGYTHPHSQQQQQQQQMHHPMHAHHVQQAQQQHAQQQQQQQQMAYGHHGHLDDLDDPRIAAMLKSGPGAGNPFAHNMPPQHHQQHQHQQHQHQQHAHQQRQHHQQQQQQRAEYYAGYRQGFGQGPFNPQGHLFTPPATAHGLPPTANPRPSTASTHSGGSQAGSPSPVGGVSPHLSLNTAAAVAGSGGSVHGSPVSTSSHEHDGSGLMVPPNTAVSPVGLSGAAAFEAATRSLSSNAQSQGKRARSGSVLSVVSGGSGGSGGGASPSYELAHHYDVGVPRRGSVMEGGYLMSGAGGMMNGMNGMGAMGMTGIGMNGMGGMGAMNGMGMNGMGGMHHPHGHGHNGHPQHVQIPSAMNGGMGMGVGVGVGVGGGNGHGMMMMM